MSKSRMRVRWIVLAIVTCALFIPSFQLVGALITSGDPCEGCSNSYQEWVAAEATRDIYYQRYIAAFNRFQHCLDQGCDTGTPTTDTPTSTTTTDTTTDSTTDSTMGNTWAPNDTVCDNRLGENCANSLNDCGCLGETCDPDHEYSDEWGCVIKRTIGTLVRSEGVESYRSLSGQAVIEGTGRIHFPEVPDEIAILHRGTGVARIGPDGTEICVYISSGSILLQVLKGAVSFSDFDYRHLVRVEENHSAIMMFSDLQPSEPMPFDPAEIERWWEEATRQDGSTAIGLANQSPTASFAVMPTSPTPEDTIRGASTSTDPDGDPLTYSWYFNGEYDSNIGNLPEWTWPNPAAGEYTITLVVIDGRGGIDEYSKAVTVVGEGEEAATSSSSTSGMLYLLLIPVAVAIAILIIRRRKKR